MTASILVAYATRAGSTQEVAEAVASALREVGIVVDVRPLREVKTLDGYRGVVVGAPLFMFRWHKDAFGFLRRHRKALSALPAAVFALGPFQDVEKDWQDVRAQFDRALIKVPWFRPVAVKVFGGKFDPATLGLPWKLIPGLKKIPATDIRDWTAIAAWARDLAAKLTVTDPPAGD